MLESLSRGGGAGGQIYRLLALWAETSGGVYKNCDVNLDRQLLVLVSAAGTRDDADSSRLTSALCCHHFLFGITGRCTEAPFGICGRH